MRRRTVFVTSALTVFGFLALLAAKPALAKGDLVTRKITITIAGPGLSRPIGLTLRGMCPVGFPCEGRMSDGLAWMSNSYLFTYGASGVTPSRPAGDLGPRYVVTYSMLARSMSDGRHETLVFHQFVYPYGPAQAPLHGPQAWIYTPAQPSFADASVAVGWHEAAGLTAILRDHGLPPAASVATPHAVAAPSLPARSRATPPWLPIWLAVTLGAMAVGGSLIVRRRRAPRSA